MGKQEAPSCWDCKFFSISWDPKYRYQCNKLGFKSSQLPSQQVLAIDERECLGFERKQNKKSSS
jgi:hypothetical protein